MNVYHVLSTSTGSCNGGGRNHDQPLETQKSFQPRHFRCSSISMTAAWLPHLGILDLMKSWVMSSSIKGYVQGKRNAQRISFQGAAVPLTQKLSWSSAETMCARVKTWHTVYGHPYHIGNPYNGIIGICIISYLQYIYISHIDPYSAYIDSRYIYIILYIIIHPYDWKHMPWWWDNR